MTIWITAIHFKNVHVYIYIYMNIEFIKITGFKNVLCGTLWHNDFVSMTTDNANYIKLVGRLFPIGRLKILYDSII